jgi:hypothetical protein
VDQAYLARGGLSPAAPGRSAHRKKRVRRPLPGMMLFQDGSTHDWLGGQAPFRIRIPHSTSTTPLFNRQAFVRKKL